MMLFMWFSITLYRIFLDYDFLIATWFSSRDIYGHVNKPVTVTFVSRKRSMGWHEIRIRQGRFSQGL